MRPGDTLTDEISDLDTCFLHPLDVLHTERLHDTQAYEVQAEGYTKAGDLWLEGPSKLTVARKLSTMDLVVCAAAQAFECKDADILEDSIQPYGLGRGVIQALQEYKGHVKAQGEKCAACATGDEAGAISTGRQGVACATGTYAAVVSHGPESAAIATGTHAAALSSANRTLSGTTESYSVAEAKGLQCAAVALGFRSVAEVKYAHSTAIATGGRSLAKAGGCMSVSVTSGDSSVAWAMDDKAIAISTGYDSQAKGALGAWLVLVERAKVTGDVLSVVSVQVDGEKIKADVVYTICDGEVVEKG